MAQLSRTGRNQYFSLMHMKQHSQNILKTTRNPVVPCTLILQIFQRCNFIKGMSVTEINIIFYTCFSIQKNESSLPL